MNLCDDANDCTDDYCTGEPGCEYVALDGGECKDGDACTAADHCDAGVGTGILFCDTSVTQFACKLEPESKVFCSQPVGLDGKCVPGAPALCNDQNQCTEDSCAPKIGCVFTAKAGPCDDGDSCTTADECTGGFCSGALLQCDDANACTTDSRLPVSGCSYAPVNDGDSCGPDLSCQGGVCTSCGQLHGSQAFSFTGSQQIFVVPKCITKITVDAFGGAGGAGEKGAPGLGGCAKAELQVQEEQTIYVNVGGVGGNASAGPGGWNGGGTGGPNACGNYGGGGGGSSYTSPAASNVVHQQGGHSGPGAITISR